MALTGVPILPPTCTGTLAVRRMWPMRLVVVVLPFDPVTPMVWPRSSGAASSTSPITSTPRSRAATRGGKSAGTSGEMTMTSQPANTAGDCRSKGMSRLSSSSRASGRAVSVCRSVARSTAPWLASSLMAAMPERFIPTTKTLAPSRSISPQLQCRQRAQGQHQAGDPETRNNLRFGPSQRLEMVMNGGHFEHPFAAAQLETSHLQNYRHRFDDEDTADKQQQHLLLNQNRSHSHGP